MIFHFRIISDESKDFARELLISSEQTFLDFHQILQENLGYDPHQLASFFITNTAWEKELQITLIDMMDDGSCTTMDCTKMEEHINPDGQRMLYVFDFFSERSFFIELTEVLENIDSKALPKITFEHGDPPAQIDLGLEDLSKSNDLTDEGPDEGFDDEELSEGFNFTEPEDYQDE